MESVDHHGRRAWLHRVAACLAISAVVVAGMATAAHADTTASAYTDGNGLTAQAGTRQGHRGHGNGAAPACTSVPLVDPKGGVAYLSLPLPGASVAYTITPDAAHQDGTWYVKWCGRGSFAGFFFVSRVNPQLLADEARRHLALPLPIPKMSPAAEQLVNLPTWLWLAGAWQPMTSTASVPGVVVTVRAVPEQVVWTMGDGSSVTCDGPGTAYRLNVANAAQAPSCSYTYRQSSATQPQLQYDASVTVLWHAQWTAAGAPGGGDLGTIQRTTAFAMRVAEVQGINTSAG